MKVFCMNDCDWMAGASMEECQADYIKNYGGDSWDEEDRFDGAHELTPDAMRRMMFHDDDGTERTFQAELDRLVAEKAEFPRFFASTEW